MGHLRLLIIQLIFITFYIFCKLFDWPGISLVLYLSWFIPITYYLILTIINLFKKEFYNTAVYFTFALLIFCLPNKFWFVYHNSIFQAFIIISFSYLLFKKHKQKLDGNFLKFTYFILSINIILLFISDEFVYKKIGPNYFKKPYTEEKIQWQDFKKVDSINGGFEATIKTHIGSLTNKAYNYTSAIASAEMDYKNSNYVEQSDKLLQHELYHFKITEYMTRKLKIELDNNHFSNELITNRIVKKYKDSLSILQETYDKETNHSVNKRNQKYWEVKIDNWLK